MYAILNVITNTILVNRFDTEEEAKRLKEHLCYVDGWVLSSQASKVSKTSKYSPTPELFEVIDVSITNS
jgi:hypothetical protein